MKPNEIVENDALRQEIDALLQRDYESALKDVALNVNYVERELTKAETDVGQLLRDGPSRVRDKVAERLIGRLRKVAGSLQTPPLVQLQQREADRNRQRKDNQKGVERKIRIAKVVAEHWSSAIMEGGHADEEFPWRTAAHPLGCVRAALDGESDPAQLGVVVDSDTAQTIRRISEGKAG